MKEAFEIFCNKTVAGSSSAELLATFCDNILKKGGSEKLSDEAIEDTLEKVLLSNCYFFFKSPDISLNFIMLLQVVKLLAYISDKDLFAEFYRFISHSNLSLSVDPLFASTLCFSCNVLFLLAFCGDALQQYSIG